LANLTGKERVMARGKLLPLALPNVEVDAYVQARFKEFLVNSNKRTFTLGDFGINEHIQPLIEKLALKRPEWRFTASYGNFHSRDDAELIIDFEVKDFQVFDKREVLGVVELGSYSYKTKLFNFMIGNHRTSAALERANSYKTSNMDKAVKLVLKHFGARDDQELYDEAYRVGVDKLSGQTREKSGMVKRLWAGSDDKTFAYILAHWDEFLMSIADVRERESLRRLPEIQEEALLLNTLYKTGTTTSGGAYTIYQQGDYYLMTCRTGQLEKKAADELPNNVRHKLGVLKLVKDGQAVSGIGFRANETTFMVFRDKE
jgi:hypothetical protein